VANAISGRAGQTRAQQTQANQTQAEQKRHWLMLPVVLIAQFMVGFDLWSVNVAAPSLQRSLHVSDAALQLIVGGYAFMYASGMVTGGRLGDLFGYRRMFTTGVVAFAAVSLLCGLAQSPDELVAARLAQGLAGAVMVPQVLALITASYPPAQRARALGWFGVTMGLSFVLGQILGGALVQAAGWRAIFLVNVPVGALALIAAIKVVPHAWSQRRPKLDPVGALGMSAGLALALVPLTLGRDEGWPLWTWVAMALALPVIAVTLLWERRLGRSGGEPLVDLSLFAERAFSAGLVVSFGLVCAFGSFMFVLTLLLQAGLGNSPLRAGTMALPLAATFTVMSILSRRLSARFGPWAITAGAFVSALGSLGLVITGAHYGTHLTGWELAPATMLIGLGNGTVIPSLIGAVLGHVNPARAGSAAGLLTTSQQFGSAAGVAVIGAIFYGALGAHGNYVHAMEAAMAVDAVMMAIGGFASLLLPRQAR
jgi:EmrB/QacA subfamily drug resistance transporter